jgi:hypothetical protein
MVSSSERNISRRIESFEQILKLMILMILLLISMMISSISTSISSISCSLRAAKSLIMELIVSYGGNFRSLTTILHLPIPIRPTPTHNLPSQHPYSHYNIHPQSSPHFSYPTTPSTLLYPPSSHPHFIGEVLLKISIPHHLSNGDGKHLSKPLEEDTLQDDTAFSD